MIFGAATLVAVGAAAFFLFQTEQQIARLKSTLRAFDVRAREATMALAELRVAGVWTDEAAENERYRYAHFRPPDGQLYELVEEA